MCKPDMGWRQDSLVPRKLAPQWNSKNDSGMEESCLLQMNSLPSPGSGTLWKEQLFYSEVAVLRTKANGWCWYGASGISHCFRACGRESKVSVESVQVNSRQGQDCAHPFLCLSTFYLLRASPHLLMPWRSSNGMCLTHPLWVQSLTGHSSPAVVHTPKD